MNSIAEFRIMILYKKQKNLPNIIWKVFYLRSFQIKKNSQKRFLPMIKNEIKLFFYYF